MSSSHLLLALAAAALFAAAPPPAAAQSPADSALVYRREVFGYPGRGRPDPFRSLLRSAEMGLRFENLVLRGILYNADPALSVAVFSELGSERRIRVRVGQRVGGIRVTAIQPRRVDLLVEEFGVARREVVEIKKEPNPGTGT